MNLYTSRYGVTAFECYYLKHELNVLKYKKVNKFYQFVLNFYVKKEKTIYTKDKTIYFKVTYKKIFGMEFVLDYSGPHENYIPQHPNCRCEISPIMKEKK